MRPRYSIPALVALTILASRGLTLAGQEMTGSDPAPPEIGEAFDAAPFGFPIREEDGKILGVRWGEPRKLRRVVVVFGEDASLPAAGSLRLQYWHRVWNGRPEPPLQERAAGAVGWEAMDDWTNGEWKEADIRLQTEGRRWTFTFNPTGAREFPKLGHPGVGYRSTLMVRLVSEQTLPASTRLATLTDAVWRPLTVRIHWGAPADPTFKADGGDHGRLEAFNGVIRAVRPLPGASLSVTAPAQWSQTADAVGGIEADLLMAVDAADGRYDRTVVTVRSERRPFSFAADEVARGERILVDDLGMLAVRGDDATTLEGFRQARREFAGRTVHRRVFDEPEQTLRQAWADMPIKHALWFVHGLPGNRNTFRQDPNGEVTAINHHWFNHPASPKDTRRKGWPGRDLRFSFGLPSGERRGGRELEEGYLPRLRTWWTDGPIHYEQTTFLDVLNGNLDELPLDDPTVLCVRIRVANTSRDQPATARLLLAGATAKGPEAIRLEADQALASTPDGPRFRFLLRTGDRGHASAGSDGLRWSLDLAPGAVHDLFLWVPSITLDQEAEIAALRKRDFDADWRRVRDYWEALTARGARLDAPEPWVTGFHKAHLRHLLVNCFKELDSDRLHAHVGTFSYGVYPDESAMMISDLDRRGYHREAERCLESFLHYQGTVQMPGNFRSTEGLFYGSGGHDTGGYNKSHGWVMWLMAEHWRFTRDRAWMERAAPKLVASCEWVIHERRATMITGPDRTRPIEYGFLPSGSLEDVTDYWYWLVTSVCTAWGFESLAGALADFGHPEAGRLQVEAAAFRRDVMGTLEEARVRSPVVRLRDGTSVPHYPSHLHQRGRSHGWLRETLEGAIHLPITGLLAPDAPQTKWIVEDFEDNLYISDQFGYAIPAFDRFWFSRGGFSMQANLLGGPAVYLERDEIKHYLRAVFNGFASAFYPETRMCNEHSLPELGYPAGDHFKSSDEAQVTRWLRLMFVHERGNDLILGQAIPREWLADGCRVGIERAPSYFGPLSLQINSRVAQGEIRATVTPPQRNPPGTLYVRLRHPAARPLQSVTVNGAVWDRFDAQQEWVILPGKVDGSQEIVARYEL